jgi:hypothetical protein
MIAKMVRFDIGSHTPPACWISEVNDLKDPAVVTTKRQLFRQMHRVCDAALP